MGRGRRVERIFSAVVLVVLLRLLLVRFSNGVQTTCWPKDGWSSCNRMIMPSREVLPWSKLPPVTLEVLIGAMNQVKVQQLRWLYY
jgi:hypothetical protein